MKRFNITKYGYKYDKIIFYSVLLILVSIFAVVLYNNDFELNKNYLYFECLGNQSCINPIYQLTCSNEKVWGKDCSIKCEEDWCDLVLLPPGKYGKEPPRIVQMFSFIAVVLMIIAFLLNHQIHNKGVEWNIEIPITKKLILNIKDIDWDKLNDNNEEEK